MEKINLWLVNAFYKDTKLNCMSAASKGYFVCMQTIMIMRDHEHRQPQGTPQIANQFIERRHRVLAYE